VKVGVLASGEGTNLQALLDTVHGREVGVHGRGVDVHGRGVDVHGRGVDVHGRGVDVHRRGVDVHGREADAQTRPVEIVAVASDQRAARALERAQAVAIPTRVFLRSQYGERAARDAAIADWLAEHDVELVVLAGYMALLDRGFIARFPDRIINVHPSLLPAFAGVRAIEQALDYGVTVFGVTVHLIDEGVDTGPIILQRALELPDARTPSEVHDRLRPIEHELLPQAVALMAAGRVRRDPDHPRRLLVG
jgi:phosphoribosylglycinamide formyltransferase 1